MSRHMHLHIFALFVLGSIKAHGQSVEFLAEKLMAGVLPAQTPSTVAVQVPLRAPKARPIKKTYQVDPSSQVAGLKTKLDSSKKDLSQIITESKPAVPGVIQGLKKSKAGVPYLSLQGKKAVRTKSGKTKYIPFRVTKFPKLNIGREPILNAGDIAQLDFKTLWTKRKLPKQPEPTMALDRKAFKKWKKKKALAPAKPWTKQIVKHKDYVKPVNSEDIANINLAADEPPKVYEKEVDPVSRETQILLSALILNKAGRSCHNVAGLLDSIKTDSDVGVEARYHLGQCQIKMGLPSIASQNLVRVVNVNDREWAPQAISPLLQQLPGDLHSFVAFKLGKIEPAFSIKKKDRNRWLYMKIKERFFGKKYTQVLDLAGEFSDSGEDYIKVLTIKAAAEHKLRRKKKAIATLKYALAEMKKRGLKDKNLKTLIHLNLGRMLYNQDKHKQSIQHFMATKKSHPLWVQSMTEQGWIQIGLQDNAGAIGNMYSLHSPFFKAVYKPETHAIRTIGYLNICQYGDAYRSLTQLERVYRDWYSQTSKYQKQNSKKTSQYYKTVSQFLRAPGKRSIDGLPNQVVREMARQKNFLNIQKAINRRVDEAEQYQFIGELIAKDIRSTRSQLKATKKSIKTLKSNLKLAKKDLNLKTKVEEWRSQLSTDKKALILLKHQLQAFRQSGKQYRRMKNRGIKKLSLEKTGYRKTASKILKKHLKKMKKSMSSVLANNEILRYEIFSGSGENIRYQVAGGKTRKTKRIPAHIKPKKIVNWEFQGEYWEDEIGSYRSSLKNNCPKRRKYAAGGVK